MKKNPKNKIYNSYNGYVFEQQEAPLLKVETFRIYIIEAGS